MEELKKLPQKIQGRVLKWLDASVDESLKKEILFQLKNHPDHLIDSFFQNLSFGTSGLRALMGVGPNRINIVTIRKASQGVANYFLTQYPPGKPIVICFDNRKHSALFAEESAQVFAANGIPCYLFGELRPVPYLSFMVRHLECGAGIMITASHNPKEYNGYKVYWSDGGEIPFIREKEIEKEIQALDAFKDVKIASLEDSLIRQVDIASLDEAYLSALDSIACSPKENKKQGNQLKIIYSSLHGTGITLAPKALARWGFTDVSLVENQCAIDEEFSTVPNPNPEHRETYSLGLAQLRAEKGDLLLLNDGDADRIGVAIIYRDNERIFNGNEIAALCAYHLCRSLKEQGRLPKNGAILTTLVTTELLKKIAASYGLICHEVHTGFKFIAEKMQEWEIKQNAAFVFGAEESYGCLIGTYARDKDGIAADCMIAEIALSMKRAGLTLLDLLHEIYHKYGVYREKQQSLRFPASIEGIHQGEVAMEKMRKQHLRKIGSYKVECIEDYEKGMKEYANGKQETLSLPKSNTLVFRLENEGKIIIRPSGTEPKLRIHVGLKINDFISIEDAMQRGDRSLDDLWTAITEMMKHET